MQHWPLTTDRLLDHATKWHGHREVVSRGAGGGLVRRTYAVIRERAQMVSAGLLQAGIKVGDRVATLAMNNVEHLEAWYGITGIGAVCHTINPRLFDAQIQYIVEHARDRIIFADAQFAPIVESIIRNCPSVEKVIFFSKPEKPSLFSGEFALFEDFGGRDDCPVAWGGFDENSAAGLCYTSGTTGNPKGVLYSHRSNVLHTMMSVQPDVFGFSVQDTILPLVPMYHANAWGITYSAPAVGARLALPGHDLGGAATCRLIEDAQVTVAAGVPTVWLSLIEYMRETGAQPKTLKRAIIGGAAAPERLILAIKEMGIEPVHAWGMTELSPVGGAGTLTPLVSSLPFAEQMPFRVRQGRSPYGVDLKITGECGEELPHDGVTSGALHVRGFAVASGYFGQDEGILDQDGWLNTGDIASLDSEGYMRITDRAKDIVKSGGEWISSQDVEIAALLHSSVRFAAVIGKPDVKWGERPIIFIELVVGGAITTKELQDFLSGHIAKWWIPDEVHLVERMPLGATGKIDKAALRRDHSKA